MRIKISKLGISFTVILTLIILSEAITKRDEEGTSHDSSNSRENSGSGWFSSSRSSPSYYRPSPSYSSPSYSRPSYSFPSYSRPSPSYTYSGSSQNYGWNVGSRNTASKPGSTIYGWNTGSNSASKPSPSVDPTLDYAGIQNRFDSISNAPPAHSPSYKNPPSYRPSYSPSFNSRPSTYYAPTETTTQATETTAEKSLSFESQVQMFFVNLIGKGDILEKTSSGVGAKIFDKLIGWLVNAVLNILDQSE